MEYVTLNNGVKMRSSDTAYIRLQRKNVKKFIENSVDSVKFLAYNDIKVESLLRNLRSVMHNTKGGMPT